jgi:hypothetical protein
VSRSESERRRHIVRVEVATMIGSAIVGGALLPLGGTPARMSLFLFGWAGGCALHLLLAPLQRRIARRLDRRS